MSQSAQVSPPNWRGLCRLVQPSCSVQGKHLLLPLRPAVLVRKAHSLSPIMLLLIKYVVAQISFFKGQFFQHLPSDYTLTTSGVA